MSTSFHNSYIMIGTRFWGHVPYSPLYYFKIYIIRLNYTTHKSDFSLVFYEAGGSNEKYTRRLKELTLRPGVDKSQTFLLRSGDEVNSAFLQLLKNSGNNRHGLDYGNDQEENIVKITKLEVQTFTANFG